jgi:KDO2-lipid IV(A) lauroyltransferase
VTDLGYILAAAAARRLPRRLSESLAVAAADLYTWMHPRRSRVVARRLGRIRGESAGGDAPPSARETHRAFARALRDFLAAGATSAEPPRVRLTPEARGILHVARSSGRSTVLVSGHFGPWEVALRWLAGEVGPVDALAAAHRSSAVERFFAGARAAYGVRTLSQGKPTAAALKRLRAGGWIAALADRGRRRRGPGSGAGALVTVDPTPLVLARRARAQVLAGVSWRAPDGAVEVRFHPVFTLEPRREGIALPQALARLQGFFDAHVRAHPTQWFDWGAGAAGPGAGAALPGADSAA